MSNVVSLWRVIFLTITATGAHAASADSVAIEFDAGMLKERGISPVVADYFKLAPRYAPGMSTVVLKVNGNRIGLVDAQFDEQGSLCATPEFLRRAHLLEPDDLHGGKKSTSGSSASCYDYRHAYPQTVITLLPNENVVDMLVPLEAISLAVPPSRDYRSGGSGGLLNYNLMNVTNHSPWASSHYWQAGTELGFNTHDWLLRSRQYFISNNGRRQWIHQYAYAQHTLVGPKAVLQVGQINVPSSLFAVGQIYGAQWFPEQALAAPTASGALVQGIAQTQSRVEVRQLGSLIFSTLVPAGPFTLRDLPLNNSNADLEVTVIDASGLQRRFIVPAASFNQGHIGAAEGFSMAVGQVQSFGADRKPWVAMAGRGWKLGQQANLATGMLLTPIYRALGVALEVEPYESVRGSAKTLASSADTGKHGLQTTLSLTYSRPDWSASLSDLHQSSGYRELGDLIQSPVQREKGNPDWFAYPGYPIPHYDRIRSQQSAGLSWNTKGWGAMSLNYAQSQYANSQKSNRVVGTWSRQFGSVSCSVSFEHATGGADYGGNTIYASLSIPLGKSSVASYVNQTPHASRVGARYSETVSPEFSYGLSADGDITNHSRSAGATISMLPRYTQVSMSADTYSPSGSSLSATMQGGIVLHGNGLTFSPYAVRDTFGVVKVGQVGGVEIQTPAGPVWTDAWGRAVIASLPDYKEARLEVATKSLPRNVDLKNGTAELQAGRGSVNHVDFGVVLVRRVLLSARLPDGSLLPKAATVLDRDDQYVTIVVGEGKIFWNYTPARLPLHVILPDGQVCELNFSIPQHADLQRYYELADAQCLFSSNGANHR